MHASKKRDMERDKREWKGEFHRDKRVSTCKREILERERETRENTRVKYICRERDEINILHSKIEV